MDELPILALDKLVEFLDFESRNALRLVCRSLKAHVEEAGLSVQINTREPGILDFCQSVNVVEARIRRLGSQHHPGLQLQSLETMILMGPVPVPWLSESLQGNCPHLTNFILSGTCLIAQDWGQPSNDSEAQPYAFSHLREVHITLNSRSLQVAVDSFEGKRLSVHKLPLGLHFQPTQEYYHRKLDKRIQRNMSYLMRQVRSRSLRVLHVFVFVRDIGRRTHWEHEPLYSFIQSHARTLERILLPNMFSGPTEADERKVYQVPTHLRTLHWTPTRRFALAPAYWRNLLLSQESLVHLTLNQLQLPPSDLTPLLVDILSRNYETLTYVHLNFCQATVQLDSFDLQILSPLKSLQSIEIDAGDDLDNAVTDLPKTTLININCLPGSVSWVKFLGIRTGPDFDGIRLMKDLRLTLLGLEYVTTVGFFKEPGHLLGFLRAVLRSRALDVVSISMDLYDYVPPEWSSGSTVAQIGGAGLELWFRNLEAGSSNHRGVSVVLEYVADVRGLGGKEPGELYEEHSECLTHMDLVDQPGYYEDREPPFRLPINAASYTIWRNQRSQAIKILPNTEAYSKRIRDIGRAQFHLNFVLEGKSANEFKPIGLEELGIAKELVSYHDVFHL